MDSIYSILAAIILISDIETPFGLDTRRIKLWNKERIEKGEKGLNDLISFYTKIIIINENFF